MPVVRRLRLRIGLALACAAFAGQAPAAVPSDKASRFYEDALSRFDKKDYGGAAVQLKNALQQDPRMLQAYVLLGQARLRDSDPAGAEEAFLDALKRGVDRAEVAVPLAKAYLQQGKPAQVVERLAPDGLTPRVKTELLALRTQAYLDLGDLPAAQRSVDAALALAPDSVPVLGAHVALLLKRGDSAGAQKVSERAVAIAPGDARAWNIKAVVLHSAGGAREALAAYEKTIALDGEMVDARLARAALLVDLGRGAEAEPELERLKAMRPGEARISYLRAVIAGKRGDSAAVRDRLAETVRLIDPIPAEILARYPQLMLLGGMAHSGLGNREKAQAYLEALAKQDARNVAARKLLGSVLMSSGKMIEAIAALEQAQRLAPNDPQVLSMLGNAYMARKDYRQAAGLLEQAAKLDGGTQMRTNLGLSLVDAGRASQGLEELQRAYAKERGAPSPGIAIALLKLKNGAPKDAVQTMDEVVKHNPDNLVALNLLGVARAATGDFAGARNAYDKVLSLDRQFVPARLNLAKLDLAQGNTTRAREQLQAVLRDFPKNTDGMVELARAEERTGRAEEAARWAEKARDHDRRNLATALYLSDLYLRRNQADKALAVANDITSFFPENLDALLLLVRAQLVKGDRENARMTLIRMTRVAEFDAPWQYRIARLQREADNPKGALYSLDKALSGDGEHIPSHALATELELQMGEIAHAQQRARSLASRFPSRAEGHRLLGDVAMARKDYPIAIAAYKTALSKEDSSDAAIRVARAHIASGSRSQAAEFLEAWLRKHPGDPAATRAAGEAYLLAGNLSAARQKYELAVQQKPDDASARNNLAEILHRQGNPRALEEAEKAYQLAPADALVADTLGWLLASQGQLERGVRFLREARLRMPENPEIRYHLAAALERQGRREEARQELEAALQNPHFENKEQALSLMKKLAAPRTVD